MTDSDKKPAAVHVIGALLRMPPKPHEDMKIGKRQRKRGLGKVESKPTKAKSKT